ncbi:MAG: hypothetical protein HRU06_07490 [Oceanospirillaceae bacterium]|nr:hypothetical protein [Oceanospirillaceae bacterium]
MIKNSILLLCSLFVFGCSEEPSGQTPTLDSSIDHTKHIIFAPPKSPALLTITGSITQFNQQRSLLLDRETLLSFPQVTVKTSTLWTDGESTFTGPLIKDVLNSAGNTADFISAIAINEYSIEIPVSDINKYSVIFALKKDGNALSIREKGPIWVIYPWSEHDELKQDKYYSRSIWQLKKIYLHD